MKTENRTIQPGNDDRTGYRGFTTLECTVMVVILAIFINLIRLISANSL